MSFINSQNLFHTMIATCLLLFLALPALLYISSYEISISKIIGPLSVTPSKVDEEGISTATKETPDLCSGRYVYIHDLPPRFNQDLLRDCHTLIQFWDFCPYMENNGFGRPLNQTGWYGTNQFTLSVIFHNRMKQYECLTSNSSLASAIYVPFYPSLQVSPILWGGFNTTVRDAGALDFTKWVREKPEWARMMGRDHFFVVGRISWDLNRAGDNNNNWGTKLLRLPESRNMTVLSIESNPYDNEFGVPYPTYFHPSSDTEVLEWQGKVRRSPKRSFLFVFAGAPRPWQSNSIRGELISQCKNATNNSCTLVHCSQNDDLCSTPTHIIEMFMKSEFCLQPPGDSYTRRSTFDSILAGCIPVFFHPKSAYTQYLWHLPGIYTSYSVYIPEEGIKNGTISIEKVLSEISEKDVSAMREEVIKLIPRIIYARKSLETFEDAFDVSVKKVLERIEDARRLFDW
ncbi:xyloglucan galactosyltransferase KATAMARI1 homolog [Beta vulgaris subsp. vulgaris]|uniref:xyloglucan galactosyltransferase KATAMARI1 homolog n=1 Tax=Beta vulgaris subsp. vulgaris TaxID=3555 RepID=UPI0020367D42|nr:xyloglucan galactosyltransferase KATAMARI1 homolog [Beta vulgaris subsp. vulgaris]